MDLTHIDATFVEAFGFEARPEGDRCYRRMKDGWAFTYSRGDTLAANLACESMTRSQFIYWVQSLGIASPWIPVTRQTPPDMESVLIAIPEPRALWDEGGRVSVGCYNIESKQWHECVVELTSGQETFEDAAVFPTHWMPRPDIQELFKDVHVKSSVPMGKITTPIRGKSAERINRHANAKD